MNNNFLTNKKVFLGILGDVIEFAVGNNYKANKLKDSSVIKKQGKKSPKSILKVTENNNDYISKNLSFNFKTLAYYQLLNEYSMLTFLNSKFKDIHFPKIINFNLEKNFVNLQTEFIKGKELNQFNSKTVIDSLVKIINSFKNTSNKLTAKEKINLPKRNALFTIINFYIYISILLLKDFNLLKNSFNLIKLFSVNMKYLINAKLVLSHKDLSGENILINNKNQIYVIDPDVCTLSIEDTDTAMIARFYLTKLKTEGVIKLMNELLRTESQQKRFIALSIYYAFQMLIIEKKNSFYYLQAKTYLETFPTLIKFIK